MGSHPSMRTNHDPGDILPLSAAAVSQISRSLTGVPVQDINLTSTFQLLPVGMRKYQIVSLCLNEWGYVSHYGAEIALPPLIVGRTIRNYCELPWPIIAAAWDSAVAKCQSLFNLQTIGTITYDGTYKEKLHARNRHFVEFLRKLAAKELPTVAIFGYFPHLNPLIQSEGLSYDWCDPRTPNRNLRVPKGGFDIAAISASAIMRRDFIPTLARTSKISRHTVLFGQTCTSLLRVMDLRNQGRMWVWAEQFPFWYFDGVSRVNIYGA